MWVIEQIDFTVGEYLLFETPFRLRHLTTDLYLSVDSNIHPFYLPTVSVSRLTSCQLLI